MAQIERPWWRRWDGVPPILERSLVRSLRPSEVWTARILLSVLFILGFAGVLRGFVWALAMLGIVAVQLVAYPAHQRAQILWRSIG